MWKRFLDDSMSIAICPALAERIVADNADKSIVKSLWIGVTLGRQYRQGADHSSRRRHA